MVNQAPCVLLLLCPFFSERFSDFLLNLDQLFNFLLKSLGLLLMCNLRTSDSLILLVYHLHHHLAVVVILILSQLE
jgi:hypothetical protein